MVPRDMIMEHETNYNSIPVYRYEQRTPLPSVQWVALCPPGPKLTRLQRFRLMLSRIPDAWRVLTGQTETID